MTSAKIDLSVCLLVTTIIFFFHPFPLIAEPPPLNERAVQSCRAVKLINARTESPVVGAEDMVFDRSTGLIYLSAYDRWAVTDALEQGKTSLPQGALYSVPVERLHNGSPNVSLQPLYSGKHSDFHPHGLARYSSKTSTRLYTLNRIYSRIDGSWVRQTQIEGFVRSESSLEHVSTIKHPKLCQANNLVAIGEREFLVTKDHGTCDFWGKWMENILGLQRSKLLHVSVKSDSEIRLTTLVDDIGFANGIAIDSGTSTVAVAGTRDEEVRFYRLESLLHDEHPRPFSKVQVNGGPDNLSWHPSGWLIAAVHPSVFWMGMARNRWLGQTRAGTNVLGIHPRSGEIRALFHDETGKQFNAGTTAIKTGSLLIVSSVLDRALLVCE